MAKRRSLIKNWAEYFFFQIMLFCIRITPFSWGCQVGRGIGLLAYGLLSPRRQLTVENIREARQRGFLPGIREEILARNVWENVGVTGAEFLYFYARDAAALKQKVELVGEEHLRRAIAQEKGTIMVTPHIGNWELLGLYLCSIGYPLNPVVKKQSNPFFDRAIQERRRSAGMNVIFNKGFLRPIVKTLKNNGIVPFLIDQAQIGSNGVPVTAFGRTAYLPPGAVEFGLKTGAPMVFACLVRQKGNPRFKAIISEVEMTKSGDYQQDLAVNTAKLMAMIQEIIAKYPEQWLWMHKFWPKKVKIK